MLFYFTVNRHISMIQSWSFYFFRRHARTKTFIYTKTAKPLTKTVNNNSKCDILHKCITNKVFQITTVYSSLWVERLASLFCQVPVISLITFHRRNAFAKLKTSSLQFPEYYTFMVYQQ